MLLKTKILLAEDDDTIVDLVYAALESAGFNVLRAGHGAQALEMLRLYTPDLLVLDVMMPVMDGIETAGHIRKDEALADTPILMLTALSSVDNKIDGLDAGADAYLPKPFDLREFKAQLKALLRVKKRGPGSNPVTGLPGPCVINDNLVKALAQKDENALVFASVPEIDTLCTRVKFDQTVATVTSMAELFQDVMTKHFQFTSFLGHGGGGEFIIVLPSDAAEGLAKDLVARFDDAQASWLPETTPVPSLTLKIAVVPVSGLESDDREGLSARVDEAVKSARAGKGSNYVVWSPPAE